MIHPTAIIDPRAQLGTDVRVAPYSVIGPGVTLGDGTEVGAHVVLEGRVEVGARCRIGHGSVIGGFPQDFKYRADVPTGVCIGDDTAIREHVTIHRATREGHDTRIGSHCLLMATTHVAHDCIVGNHVIMINFSGLTGHVVVGDRATVGGLSGVRPFARIGTLAYVGGCSKVHQDVPPFVMAVGVPATARAVNVVGMRRAGIDAASRRVVQSAFRILYRAGLAPGTGLARVKAELGGHPLVDVMVQFIEASKLGIVARPGRRDPALEMEEPIR